MGNRSDGGSRWISSSWPRQLERQLAARRCAAWFPAHWNELATSAKRARLLARRCRHDGNHRLPRGARREKPVKPRKFAFRSSWLRRKDFCRLWAEPFFVSRGRTTGSIPAKGQGLRWQSVAGASPQPKTTFLRFSLFILSIRRRSDARASGEQMGIRADHGADERAEHGRPRTDGICRPC